MTPAFIAALLFGYLLGSIPFGLLLTRMAGTGDIRHIGSGNIGATNVLRTGHKGLAAATLIGDMLKGTVAVLVAAHWAREAALIAGLGAFIGHLFPVWLGFKGGKGVATYLGILIALSWQAALAFGVVWAATAAISRYSSLSGLLASLAALATIAFAGERDLLLLVLALTIALWLTHRANLARLMHGTEGKIGR
jgi:glycerol-3-phosphate acyltransferase PlsY